VSLVSRGPILSGLAPYARRTFLPLLQVRCLPCYCASLPCGCSFGMIFLLSCLSSTVAFVYHAILHLLLQERGVALYEGSGGVAKVQPSSLLLADGQQLPFDECLWSTQASAASWLGDTGLPVDAGGFCCCLLSTRVTSWSLLLLWCVPP
jgi:hypothetical protein